jgi:hypothetical protein
MAVMLTSKWWKKAKPITLLGETVTKALKSLDDVSDALYKEASRENLAAVAGAMKVLQGEIVKTRGKCHKVLHKTCILELNEAEEKAKKAYSGIQVLQKAFVADLSEYQKIRDVAAKTLAKIASDKKTAAVDAAKTAVNNFLNWLNEGIKNGKLSSKEMTAGMKYLTGANLLLGDIQKTLAKKPVTDPDKNKQQQQLNGQFAELAEVAKKIGTLGGFTEQPRAAMKYKIEL